MLWPMFNLESYLNERRAVVDQALATALPPVASPPALLHEMMRYCVFTGGKRLRPILALAASDAVGGDDNAAIFSALAVEVLHTYTLIHDDLPCMDDDDVRRGQPTAHIKFGEANAVLAADALQALSFGLAARVPAPAPHAPTALVTELAASSHAVVGGQVEDIAATPANLTPEKLHYIHVHKTAFLFRASVRMGAIAGGAELAQLEQLTCFGEQLGLAFQLIDDILDADDLDADPMADPCSSIHLYGEAQTRQMAKDATAAAIEALGSFGDGAHPLVATAEHMLKRTL
jgi:geranylgeranyl diphosphate synthase type II